MKNKENKKQQGTITYSQSPRESKKSHKYIYIYLGLLQNSNRRPRLEKMMSPTSASHKTDSSYAFLSSPLRRFANVTCRLILFSILFNSTLPLPISPLSLSKDLSLLLSPWGVLLLILILLWSTNLLCIMSNSGLLGVTVMPLAFFFFSSVQLCFCFTLPRFLLSCEILGKLD